MANTSSYNDFFTGSIVDPTEFSYLSYTLTQSIQLVWPSYLPPSTVSGLPLVPAPRNLDVTATVSTASIRLPQGNYGSVGTSILIKNIGINPFVVTDNTGAQSTLVGAGSAIYFYLRDNTTSAGVWSNTGFGTGTSTADANALAGNGLISLGGKLNTQVNVTQIASSGYLFNDASRANLYVWRGGLGTLNLPAISTLSANWFIGIRNQGTGTLTITPSDPSATINNTNSLSIDVNTSMYIVLDNSTFSFFSIGTVGTQNFSWSSATYDTSAIPTNSFDLTQSAPTIQRYVDIGGTRTASLTVTLPATAAIYSFVNSTANTNYNLNFLVIGSTVPAVVLMANQQAFAISDGLNLYSLGTQTLGAFALNDGSAIAPPLYFSSDIRTGVYRPGTSVFGISAGGSPLLQLNGSDPNNLIINSNATAQFLAIDGGLI